jgi:hypothetical protein
MKSVIAIVAALFATVAFAGEPAKAEAKKAPEPQRTNVPTTSQNLINPLLSEGLCEWDEIKGRVAARDHSVASVKSSKSTSPPIRLY